MPVLPQTKYESGKTVAMNKVGIDDSQQEPSRAGDVTNSILGLLDQTSSQLYEYKQPDTYFCSELVAAAYQAMGLLSRELPPADYWPRSFEMSRTSHGKRKRLEMVQKARLGEE